MRKLYIGLLILPCALFGVFIGWVVLILPQSSDKIATCGMSFHYLHWGRKDAAPNNAMNVNLIISSERVIIAGYLEQDGEYAKINRIINLTPPLNYPGGVVEVSSLIRQRDDEIAEGGKFDLKIIKNGKFSFRFHRMFDNNYIVNVNDYKLGVCRKMKE
jgi:hypothetical protein